MTARRPTMQRLPMPRLLGVILAAAVAACGPATPSGPGTAVLEIHGMRGACEAFSCSYVARLDGPGGPVEAGFIRPFEGLDLALGPDFPVVLSDGDYELTFELRLMSDLLNHADGSRDFDIAMCRTGFNVGPGRSHVMVRVTFGVDRCAISLDARALEASGDPAPGAA